MRLGFKVGPFIIMSGGRRAAQTPAKPLPRNAKGKIQPVALAVMIVFWTVLIGCGGWLLVKVLVDEFS